MFLDYEIADGQVDQVRAQRNDPTGLGDRHSQVGETGYTVWAVDLLTHVSEGESQIGQVDHGTDGNNLDEAGIQRRQVRGQCELWSVQTTVWWWEMKSYIPVDCYFQAVKEVAEVDMTDGELLDVVCVLGDSVLGLN